MLLKIFTNHIYYIKVEDVNHWEYSHIILKHQNMSNHHFIYYIKFEAISHKEYTHKIINNQWKDEK